MRLGLVLIGFSRGGEGDCEDGSGGGILLPFGLLWCRKPRHCHPRPRSVLRRVLESRVMVWLIANDVV